MKSIHNWWNMGSTSQNVHLESKKGQFWYHVDFKYKNYDHFISFSVWIYSTRWPINAMFNREAVSDWICLCVLKNARNDIYRKKRALGQTIIVPITRELLLRLPRKIKFFFWSITVNDTVFWKLKIHVGCGWPITICVTVWMQQIIYYLKLFKTQSDEKKSLTVC